MHVPGGPDVDLGEHRSFSLVEHSTGCVVLLDARGRVFYANPAAEALLGLPASRLHRIRGLSPTEFEPVKTHCAIGADIITSIQFPWPVGEMVRQHHERLDGSGYPREFAL